MEQKWKNYLSKKKDRKEKKEYESMLKRKLTKEERSKHLEPVGDLLKNLGKDSKRFNELVVPYKGRK